MTAPPRLVVDASVAFKWFATEGEDHVEQALALLHSHVERTEILAAPDHLRLEVLNALRTRRLPPGILADVSRRLEGFRLEWHRLDAPLVAAACASMETLTPYDAVYVALAAQLDCELVTADRRLAGCTACRTRLL